MVKNISLNSTMYAAILTLLFGCAPGNVRDLRGSPGGKLSFTAQQTMLTTYERLLAHTKACMEYSVVRVDHDLFESDGRGSVTATAYLPFGPEVQMQADITKLASNSTQVDIYYAFGSMVKRVKAMEKAVESEYRECISD